MLYIKLIYIYISSFFFGQNLGKTVKQEKKKNNSLQFNYYHLFIYNIIYNFSLVIESPLQPAPSASRWVFQGRGKGCGPGPGGWMGKRTRLDPHSRRTAATPGPTAGWTPASP